jgi:hypothetical protein
VPNPREIPKPLNILPVPADGAHAGRISVRGGLHSDAPGGDRIAIRDEEFLVVVPVQSARILLPHQEIQHDAPLATDISWRLRDQKLHGCKCIICNYIRQSPRAWRLARVPRVSTLPGPCVRSSCLLRNAHLAARRTGGTIIG